MSLVVKVLAAGFFPDKVAVFPPWPAPWKPALSPGRPPGRSLKEGVFGCVLRVFLSGRLVPPPLFYLIFSGLGISSVKWENSGAFLRGWLGGWNDGMCGNHSFSTGSIPPAGMIQRPITQMWSQHLQAFGSRPSALVSPDPICEGPRGRAGAGLLEAPPARSGRGLCRRHVQAPKAQPAGRKGAARSGEPGGAGPRCDL